VFSDFSKAVSAVAARQVSRFASSLAQSSIMVREKVAGHDVVLVLLVQRPHDRLEFLGEIKGAQLRRVAQAIHHVGDAAVLEAFGDGLPAVLDKPWRRSRVDAFLDHLVEAEHRAGLQHAAENGLLAHEV
jgi:hypothetical protein